MTDFPCVLREAQAEAVLGLRESIWANFGPLSSCRDPQAAPKCSKRGDSVTRD